MSPGPGWVPRRRARAVWALAGLVILTGGGLFGLTRLVAALPAAVAVAAMIVALDEPGGGRRSWSAVPPCCPSPTPSP